MSSVPLRPRSPFFSYDSETGSRRPRWFTVLAGFLALLIAAAGVLVGVSAASAHIPKFNVDCYGLSVELLWYDTGGDNSVYVEIGDQVKVDIADFGSDFPYQYWAFANAGGGIPYKVVVKAWDDPTGSKGYSFTEEGVSPACKTPTIGLNATQCSEIGKAGRLQATFSDLIGGQTYVAKLLKSTDGVTFTEVETFTPSTVNPKVWDPLTAGFIYRVTVESTNPAGLSAFKDVTMIGCPQNNKLIVTVNQCTSPDVPNASLHVVASDLVPGRTYIAQIFKNGTLIPGDYPVTVTNGGWTADLPVPPSTQGLTVKITDVGFGITAESSPALNTDPCPTRPTLPSVTSQECKTVNGPLDITVTVGSLTPGRSYLIAIDGGTVATIVAQTSDTFKVNGTGTTLSSLTFASTVGAHTVTIQDEALPAIISAPSAVEVKACPTEPLITLSLDQCSVPGGKGGISAKFDDLGSGRAYEVTITFNNNAVPGYPTVPFSVTAPTTSYTIDYTDLAVGPGYLVTIRDVAAGLTWSEGANLEACPNTPKIDLSLECLLLEGDSLITASVSDLQNGVKYDVVVTAGSPGSAGGAGAATLAAPVASTQITGGPTPSTVTFQLPNNVTYTVTVTKVGNAAVTNAASIFAAICDLPDLPTLALTGSSDTTMPMLGALGLVQFGVALLALAAMLQFHPRRRIA